MTLIHELNKLPSINSILDIWPLLLASNRTNNFFHVNFLK